MKIFILFLISTLSTTFGSNVDSLYVKGNEHYLEGEFNDAIENYEKCLELNPSHFKALKFLSNCYKDIKKFKEKYDLMNIIYENCDLANIINEHVKSVNIKLRKKIKGNIKSKKKSILHLSSID